MNADVTQQQTGGCFKMHTSRNDRVGTHNFFARLHFFKEALFLVRVHGDRVPKGYGNHTCNHDEPQDHFARFSIAAAKYIFGRGPNRRQH